MTTKFPKETLLSGQSLSTFMFHTVTLINKNYILLSRYNLLIRLICQSDDALEQIMTIQLTFPIWRLLLLQIKLEISNYQQDFQKFYLALIRSDNRGQPDVTHPTRMTTMSGNQRTFLIRPVPHSILWADI